MHVVIISFKKWKNVYNSFLSVFLFAADYTRKSRSVEGGKQRSIRAMLVRLFFDRRVRRLSTARGSRWHRFSGPTSISSTRDLPATDAVVSSSRVGTNCKYVYSEESHYSLLLFFTFRRQSTTSFSRRFSVATRARN